MASVNVRIRRKTRPPVPDLWELAHTQLKYTSSLRHPGNPRPWPRARPSSPLGWSSQWFL